MVSNPNSGRCLLRPASLAKKQQGLSSAYDKV